jgi:hypothetical protein
LEIIPAFPGISGLFRAFADGECPDFPIGAGLMPVRIEYIVVIAVWDLRRLKQKANIITRDRDFKRRQPRSPSRA